jgi:hypothetical protein
MDQSTILSKFRHHPIVQGHCKLSTDGIITTLPHQKRQLKGWQIEMATISFCK